MTTSDPPGPPAGRQRRRTTRRTRLGNQHAGWIDELKSISVLELSERIEALEEEFGVSATAGAAAAPAGAPTAGGDDRAAAAQEQTALDVVVTGAGDKKTQVIKVVRGPRLWPQGDQGARRRGPQAGQGGRRARGGRLAPRPARGGRASVEVK